MNIRTANLPEWPITIVRDPAGGATVLLEDGRRVELDAFRDDCRALAVALRGEAMDNAMAATVAALRRMAVHRHRRDGAALPEGAVRPAQ